MLLKKFKNIFWTVINNEVQEVKAEGKNKKGIFVKKEKVIEGNKYVYKTISYDFIPYENLFVDYGKAKKNNASKFEFSLIKKGIKENVNYEKCQSL